MSTEAMKQALEALKFGLHVGFDESSESQIKKGGKAFDQHNKAITALRTAIAEAEKQEPVCDKDPRGCWNVRCQLGKVCKNTTPPQQEKQEPIEWLTGFPECGADSGCDCESGTWNPPAAQPAPVQEPVAWVADGVLMKIGIPEKYTGYLYTTPPAAQPAVPLTDEQREAIMNKQNWPPMSDPCIHWFFRGIDETEAAHGITGDTK